MRVPTRRLGGVGALLLVSVSLAHAAAGEPRTSQHAVCVAGATMTAAAWRQEKIEAPAAGPQARAILRVRGTLPHTGIHDVSAAAEHDFAYMLDLALAWRITGNRADLAELAGYFDAWTRTYRPSFDPIDETNFDGLVEAFGLTKSALPRATALEAADFVRAIGAGYLDRMERSRYPFPGNNWQSHRIKLATLSAVALDDDELLLRARAAFERQLAANMAWNGEVRDFRERDALLYVTYDLEPLVRAALAARTRGQDWLAVKGPSGQSLETGLDWLLPYAEGRQSHMEFVHSTEPFDAARDRAGLKGYSGLWDRKRAAALYWSAAALDRRYLPVATALSGEPPLWLFAYAAPCGIKATGTIALAGERR